MSTSTADDLERSTPVLAAWQAGAVGGILGAVLWGIYATLQTPALLETYLPEALGLGAEQFGMGWILLLAIGGVLGAAFAVGVENSPLDERLTDNVTNGQAGLGYGIVTWLVVTALLVPVLAGAVGSTDVDVPLLDIGHLVGHVLYGTVVGLAYAVLAD